MAAAAVAAVLVAMTTTMVATAFVVAPAPMRMSASAVASAPMTMLERGKQLGSQGVTLTKGLALSQPVQQQEKQKTKQRLTL